MFYAQCPKCGGKKVESAEAEDVERGFRNGGAIIHRATQGHPYLRLAGLAISAGRQIYKRVPGGGQKRCTSCGHLFR